MAIRGIDVSSHQGIIDWAKVPSEIQFAFTKATEGTNYTNPTFARNWEGIKATGRVRGAYHFARPSENGPTEEANYFLQAIQNVGGLKEGDLIALDMEDTEHSGDLYPWTLAWLKYVEENTGLKPFLYSGRWYMEPHSLLNRPALAEYGLWYAAYQAELPPAPSAWPFVAIWQYGDTERLPGINGPVDTDEFNGDSIEQLRRYGLIEAEKLPSSIVIDKAKFEAILKRTSKLIVDLQDIIDDMDELGGQV